MKLRTANKDDFADQWGNKKLGTLYFCINCKGEIETQPNYFTNQTDMNTFRQLYTHNQILVPVRAFEDVEVVEK